MKIFYVARRSHSRGRFTLGGFFVAGVLAGALLRTHFYTLNRSLWADEASLALNIVQRSFTGLLRPLEPFQVAPIGFLVLAKASVSILGSSEYGLRLVPLLAGLGSLPLMCWVSRRYAQGIATSAAIVLFILSPRLVYYSSEAKQYSSDVLASLALLLAASYCLTERESRRALVLLALVGTVAIWLSHPALFVFLSAVGVLTLHYALGRNHLQLRRLAAAAAVVGINFLLAYMVSLRYSATNAYVLAFWKASFAPLPPWSNLAWYKSAVENLLIDPMALPASALTVGLLSLGIVSSFLRQWRSALILTLPPLLALAASALSRYPFAGRLLLFLVPNVLLLVAEGVERARSLLRPRSMPLAALVTAALLSYLLMIPVLDTYRNLRFPPAGEDIRGAVAYASNHYRDTDLIYVYYGSEVGYDYYAPRYRLGAVHHLRGVAARNDPQEYLNQIDTLKGRTASSVLSSPTIAVPALSTSSF